MRNTPLLGSHSRTAPGVLWWSRGGGLFLMSEVPLFTWSNLSPLVMVGDLIPASTSSRYAVSPYHARVQEGVAKSQLLLKGSGFQRSKPRICAVLRGFTPSTTLARYGIANGSTRNAVTRSTPGSGRPPMCRRQMYRRRANLARSSCQMLALFSRSNSLNPCKVSPLRSDAGG